MYSKTFVTQAYFLREPQEHVPYLKEEINQEWETLIS